MTQAVTTTDQPPRLPTIQAGGSVRAIVPQDFEGAWRIANAVVKSGMAPKGIDTAEKAMVAIMHGLEVGMTPMTALQSIAPINGRPAIWGDGALGLCQGSGLLEWHKEYYKGTAGADDYTAVCEVKRRGDPEIKIGEFSIADAKQAQLFGKAGPWQQYTKRMLKMRARAFALRDGFSDVLRGLHIAEEAQDIQPPRDVTPPPIPPVPTAAGAPKLPPHDPETGEIWDDQPVADGPPVVPPPVPESAAPPTSPAELFPPDEQWLRDLEGAFSGCEDFASLGDAQAKYMAPQKGKVSHEAWKRAEEKVREHLTRVNQTILDAG